MMGLAAFGKLKFYEDLKKTIKFENNQLITDTRYYDYVRRTDRSYSNFLIDLLKIEPRQPDIPLEIGKKNFQTYADLAASAQKILEDLLFLIFKYFKSNFRFFGLNIHKNLTLLYCFEWKIKCHMLYTGRKS